MQKWAKISMLKNFFIHPVLSASLPRLFPKYVYQGVCPGCPFLGQRAAAPPLNWCVAYRAGGWEGERKDGKERIFSSFLSIVVSWHALHLHLFIHSAALMERRNERRMENARKYLPERE